MPKLTSQLESDEDIDASKHKVRILTDPSIGRTEDMMQIGEEVNSPEWAKDVIQYLKNGQLPKSQEGILKDKNVVDTIYNGQRYLV